MYKILLDPLPTWPCPKFQGILSLGLGQIYLYREHPEPSELTNIIDNVLLFVNLDILYVIYDEALRKFNVIITSYLVQKIR